VVLSGVYRAEPGPLSPELALASVARTSARPITFQVVADGNPVPLIPIARGRP